MTLKNTVSVTNVMTTSSGDLSRLEFAIFNENIGRVPGLVCKVGDSWQVFLDTERAYGRWLYSLTSHSMLERDNVRHRFGHNIPFDEIIKRLPKSNAERAELININVSLKRFCGIFTPGKFDSVSDAFIRANITDKKQFKNNHDPVISIRTEKQRSQVAAVIVGSCLKEVGEFCVWKMQSLDGATENILVASFNGEVIMTLHSFCKWAGFDSEMLRFMFREDKAANDLMWLAGQNILDNETVKHIAKSYGEDFGADATYHCDKFLFAARRYLTSCGVCPDFMKQPYYSLRALIQYFRYGSERCIGELNLSHEISEKYDHVVEKLVEFVLLF